MAGRLSTPGSKRTDHSIAGNNGLFYECGSIEEIDRHLKHLGLRISLCNPNMNNIRQDLIEDRDRLLDYRFLLAAFLAEE